MLMNKKNDLMYLLNILEHIGKICKYVTGTSDADELYALNNQLNFNASLTLLANIGENVSKISNELKSENAHVNWQEIKDFRNKIVHDYAGVSIVIVFETITNDLPRLKDIIEDIVRVGISNNTFDKDELLVSQNSSFYSNIEFQYLLH